MGVFANRQNQNYDFGNEARFDDTMGDNYGASNNTSSGVFARRKKLGLIDSLQNTPESLPVTGRANNNDLYSSGNMLQASRAFRQQEEDLYRQQASAMPVLNESALTGNSNPYPFASGEIIPYEEYYKNLPWYKKILAEEPLSAKQKLFEKGQAAAENKTPFLDDVKEGVRQMVLEGARGIANTVYRSPGMRDIRQKVTGFYPSDKENLIDENPYYQGYEQKSKELYEQKPFVGKVAEDVSKGIGSSLIAFTPAGLAGFGVLAGGKSAQEKLDQGYSPTQAGLYGTVVGGAEAQVERLGINPAKIIEKGFAEDIIKTFTLAGKKNIGNMLKNLLNVGGQEALEEMLMEPISGLADKLIADTNRKWFGEGGVIDPKQILYSGLVGGLSGIAMGGAGLPSQYEASKQVQQEMENNLYEDLKVGLNMPEQTESFQLALEYAQNPESVTFGQYNELLQTLKDEIPKVNNIPKLWSMAGQNKTYTFKNQQQEQQQGGIRESILGNAQESSLNSEAEINLSRVFPYKEALQGKSGIANVITESPLQTQQQTQALDQFRGVGNMAENTMPIESALINTEDMVSDNAQNETNKINNFVTESPLTVSQVQEGQLAQTQNTLDSQMNKAQTEGKSYTKTINLSSSYSPVMDQLGEKREGHYYRAVKDFAAIQDIFDSGVVKTKSKMPAWFGREIAKTYLFKSKSDVGYIIEVQNNPENPFKRTVEDGTDRTKSFYKTKTPSSINDVARILKVEKIGGKSQATDVKVSVIYDKTNNTIEKAGNLFDNGNVEKTSRGGVNRNDVQESGPETTNAGRISGNRKEIFTRRAYEEEAAIRKISTRDARTVDERRIREDSERNIGAPINFFDNSNFNISGLTSSEAPFEIFIGNQTEYGQTTAYHHETFHYLRKTNKELFFDTFDYFYNAFIKTPEFFKAKDAFIRSYEDSDYKDYLNETDIAVIDELLANEFANMMLPVKNFDNSTKINQVLDDDTVEKFRLVAQKFYSDITKYSNIKDKSQLPNTIDDLEDMVSFMRDKKRKGIKVNLQLFAEAEKKLDRLKAISKFFENTLQNHTELTDEEKKMFNAEDYVYDRVSEENSLRQATERLSKDFDGEVENIRKNGINNGVDTDVAMAILEVYKQEGRETGDYSKMIEWASMIRKNNFTDLGRAIQALAKYSRSPEQIIMEAQKIVDDVEEETKKAHAGMIEEIDNEAKVVEKVLEEADKKAAEDTVDEIKKEEEKQGKKRDKKTGNQSKAGDAVTDEEGDENLEEAEDEEPDPAELLAEKIKKTLKGPKAKEKDVVMQMVNELYAKFREQVDEKDIPKKIPPDKVQEFLDAVKNKDVSDKVWQEAKKIVREFYANDTFALNILEEYFGKGTKPPFSEKTADIAIKKVMKKLEYKLSDMVKNYYAKGAQQRVNIVEYFKAEAKLQEFTDDEINVLANYVDNKFKTWKKEYAENYLKQMYRERPSSAADKEANAVKFIDSVVNADIFLNQNYSNRVNEKLDPKIRTLIRTAGIKMHELVKLGKNKTEFVRDAFIEALKDKVNISQADAERVAAIAKRVFDEQVALARERILKGMLLSGKSSTSKAKKKMVDKVMELINLDAYSNQAIRDIIKQKNNLPVLENEDIEAIFKAVEARNLLEPNSYLYRMLTDKIELIMANKVPANVRDKIKGLQRIWMLLNTKTNVRNIAGNIILNSTENLKDLFGAPIDIFLSKARGSERTTLFNPVEKARWQVEGLKTGVKESVLDLKYSFDKEFSRDMSWNEIVKNLRTFQLVNTANMNERFDIGKNELVDTLGKRYELRKGRVFDSDTLNFLDNTVKTFLKFGDRPFFEAAYNMRLKELMKIRGLNKPDAEVDILAQLYAMDRVFQNNSELAKRLTKIKDVAPIIGDIIVPFTQTPANIIDKLLQYTPAGMGKALFELGKLSNNRRVKKIAQGEFNQKEFVDRVARSLTGTGIASLGFVLMALGLVAIAGGEDKRERVRQHQKVTSQAYSVKIGDKWYSFDALQPIGGILAMGVDAYIKSKDEAGFLASIGAGFNAAGITFVRMSFMREFVNVVSSISENNGGFNSFLTKLFRSAVGQTNPTFIKQLSDISDDYVREVYDPNPVKQAVKQYISKIPGLSRTLPVKVDVYGDKIKRYDDANNIVNVMFNPIFIKDVEKNPVQVEISKVFAKTNNVNVLPAVADDVIRWTYQGTTYPLTLDAQQYINYQKLSGKLLTETAGKVIVSDEYKKLSGTDNEFEVKAKILSDIVKKSHETAREYVIEEYIQKKIKSKIKTREEK